MWYSMWNYKKVSDQLMYFNYKKPRIFFLRLRFKMKLIWKKSYWSLPGQTDADIWHVPQTSQYFCNSIQIGPSRHFLFLSNFLTFRFFFCFQIFFFTDFQKVGGLLIFKSLNWKSVKHQENYTLATLVL